ncbi:MAG: hypothetical protein C9356_11085 [Oleiphilus sp.]|nr:MAG: hypothetical protein C9356_11085 [Oleiphilus sp.]
MSMSGLFSLSRLGRYCAPMLVAGVLSAGNVNNSVANELSDQNLSLDLVLTVVKENDFRLKQLHEESKAFLADSEAASYLPDPTVFAALQSLPTDTFDFDQEPMTQLRVGVRQMFPKGDVLDIKSDISVIQSDAQSIASKLRWLERKQQSEHAWLEAWYSQKRLALLEEDQVFLGQVQEFVRSLYEVGAKDQSDLIGADLELIKLNEKRIEEKRKYQIFRQQLNTLANQELVGSELSPILPDLTQLDFENVKQSELRNYLLQHPKIELLNQKIVLADRKVDLVNQDFEPAWSLEVSYGLRGGENMDGSDRPDFFSAGVNVQIPLFSNNKQQQNQYAASQRSRVSQIKRDEALSQMRFEVDNLIQQYRNTQEQRRLYEINILPTLERQRKSALQSYESDKGNFNLVMNLFLKEQSAKTMRQRLRVNEQKLISSLNYLLGLDSTHAKNGAQ